MKRDRDPEQNPYRSPQCPDETQPARPWRQRSRDLAQAGISRSIPLAYVRTWRTGSYVLEHGDNPPNPEADSHGRFLAPSRYD
jgi:hypothetical protein